MSVNPNDGITQNTSASTGLQESADDDDDDVGIVDGTNDQHESTITASEQALAAAAAAASVEAALEGTTIPTSEVTDTSVIINTAVVVPNDRDVILGEGSAGHKTNFLLQDVIRLHRILWKLHDKPPPESASDVKEMALHIMELIKNGKKFELAGLKDVPKQFMKSKGRFLRQDPSTQEWTEMSEDDIRETMCEILLEDFKMDDLGSLQETPYKELREWIEKKTVTQSTPYMPEGRDAILLPCEDLLADKMYEQQAGNKTMFSLASHLVTSYTNNPAKRIEAALNIMRGLDDAETMAPGDKETTTTSKSRFLIRSLRQDQSVSWDMMDAASAAEFTLIFTFEVFLEKVIIILPSQKQETSASGLLSVLTPLTHDIEVPESTEPVPEPTEFDVLFGRGGMTNSHSGNRRFRDIIALHRPDYIRAIKMDKPAVARKIVKAIRYGNPPGRFLRKGGDGYWHDVGDRTAAEKTSQGLRERSNAEKRQRSALREALGIRKEDLTKDSVNEKIESKLQYKKTRSENLAEVNAALVPTLNYIGTNLPVPLSLNMRDAVAAPRRKVSVVKKRAADNKDPEELNTEGLPPNAVDEDGNVLVTDYDILCGRGGLTNHHKGNKRFRDVVALHRPDYVRAPKVQKPSVARVIVRAIRNGDPPGRFLRKDEATGRWIEIDDKKAAEKTSQALREKPPDEAVGNIDKTQDSIWLPGASSLYLTGGAVAEDEPDNSKILETSIVALLPAGTHNDSIVKDDQEKIDAVTVTETKDDQEKIVAVTVIETKEDKTSVEEENEKSIALEASQQSPPFETASI